MVQTKFVGGGIVENKILYTLFDTTSWLVGGVDNAKVQSKKNEDKIIYIYSRFMCSFEPSFLFPQTTTTITAQILIK